MTQERHRLWRGCAGALLLLLAGAFLRLPKLFLHGRIWAEEASVMLAHNWHSTFFQILLAPQFGYFSLWDNFWTAVAVRVLPLQFAAYLFTGSSVLVLLGTGYFVYQAEFLTTDRVRLGAVLALLVVVGDTESWLNLINSQFSFGLWSSILLLCSTERLVWRRCGALTLAVLSGPLTVLLTPFFVVRALRDRHRGAWLQAGIVLAGAVVQIGVALMTKTGNRTLRFHPSTLAPILLLKEFVLPLLGRPIATLAARAVLHHVPVSVAVCWVIFGVLAFALFRLLRGSRVALCLLLIAGWLGLLQTVLALGGGLLNVQPGFGERYAYIPNTLLLLSLIVAVVQGVGRTLVLRGLLCCALAAGALDYVWLPWRVPDNASAPAWYPQAKLWQREERTALKSDPGDWPPLHLPHTH